MPKSFQTTVFLSKRKAENKKKCILYTYFYINEITQEISFCFAQQTSVYTKKNSENCTKKGSQPKILRTKSFTYKLLLRTLP